MSRANAVRRDSGSADSRCKGRSSVRRGMARVKQSSTHDPSKYSHHLDGDISEHLTAYELVKQGWGVCFPQNSHAPFDLLAEKHGVVLRIQVKATRGTEKCFRPRRYGTRLKGVERRRKLTCADCDVLVLCLLPKGELFVVPVNHITGKSYIRINSKNRKLYYRKFENLQPCNLSYTQ